MADTKHQKTRDALTYVSEFIPLMQNAMSALRELPSQTNAELGLVKEFETEYVELLKLRSLLHQERAAELMGVRKGAPLAADGFVDEDDF